MFPKVQPFSTQIRCVNSCTKYHAKFVNLERTEVAGRELWYCPFCIQSVLPYTHIYNDDKYTAAILENIVNYPTSLEDINNNIFVPFEINYSDSPLSETDPDVQFYSENHYIQSTSCDYYFEDNFNSKIGNKCSFTDKLSFFTWISRASPNTIMNWNISRFITCNVFIYRALWNLVGRI